MRAIGSLQPESLARTFSDYLYVQGIENQIEAEDNGAWTIWIHAEDQIDTAREMLEAYRQNPADPRYAKEARQAEELREEKVRSDERYRARMHDRATLFRRLAGYGLGPVTLILICLSAAVFLFSGMGRSTAVIAPFLISEYDVHGNNLWSRLGCLLEIRHGQVWRLFSPMLIHFGILHILFNMLWLRDLGSMIESRLGGRYFITLVLAISMVSNVAQFVVKGPVFGGMSGVVYGLFGFIWIRAKFDPLSGLFLHPTTVTMMIIWFFLCFTGMVGNIANTVHATGLVLGMVWGWISSQRRI